MNIRIIGIALTAWLCFVLSGCGVPAPEIPEQTTSAPAVTETLPAPEETASPSTVPEEATTLEDATIPEESTVPATEAETVPAETASPTSQNPVLLPPEIPEEPCHYFDDAAFLGDSISYSLMVHNTRTQDLGNALFLVRGSLGLYNTLHDVLTVSYQGMPLTPWDALKASGVSKVYIMLGTNDIGYWGIEETMANWEQFVTNIRQACPDIQIVIQAQTPMWIPAEQALLNNANIDLYNQKLQEFAEENDCLFLDIAPYFKNSENGLAAVYCNDEYVHLSAAGTATWAKVLRAHAAEMEKEIG